MISPQLADELTGELLILGNKLRPVDDVNFFFFEIVRELVDSALTNYAKLKAGHSEPDYALLAWACRNLLELAIFTKYVLISAENAQRFADDRLVDGSELVKALIDLEHYHESDTETVALNEVLRRMREQMANEYVTATKHLDMKKIVAEVRMKEWYVAVNRVCSKLVHPTAWSVLAMNKGTNAFEQSREILFDIGVGFLREIYLAIHGHNARQGMTPNR